MRIIGIDPGKAGGISWLDCTEHPDGLLSLVFPAAVKMPEREADISARFRELKASASGDVYAFIEQVHAMPATRQVQDDGKLDGLTNSIANTWLPSGAISARADIRAMLRSAGVGNETRVIQGSVGTFTFGQGYGFLRGCLRTAEIPFESVRPQDWQNVCGCRTRGDKNVSKNRAIQLFRQMPKITHAIADALLIAEYGRRIGVRGRRPEQ